MGNLGGAEILVILLVALVVLGPTKLPTAIRQVGRVIGEVRRIGAGFQQELREATEPLREPLRETQAALKAADRELREATKPLKEAAGTIKGADSGKIVAPAPKGADKPAAIDPFASAVASSAAAAGAPSTEPAAGESAGSTDAAGQMPAAETAEKPDSDSDASEASDGAAEAGSGAGGSA